jgi:hypothetical protein
MNRKTQGLFFFLSFKVPCIALQSWRAILISIRCKIKSCGSYNFVSISMQSDLKSEKSGCTSYLIINEVSRAKW